MAPGCALADDPGLAQQRHQSWDSQQQRRERGTLEDPLWVITQSMSGTDDFCRINRCTGEEDILRPGSLQLRGLRSEVCIGYRVGCLSYVVQVVGGDRFIVACVPVLAVLLVLCTDAGGTIL